MGFLQYLILGSLAYGAGVAVRHKLLAKNWHNRAKIYQFTGGFFILMLGVSWAINAFVLQKSTPDIAFIVVTALVASFIFYQGISPDENQQVPD